MQLISMMLSKKMLGFRKSKVIKLVYSDKKRTTFQSKPQKTKSKQQLHLTGDEPKKSKAHLLVAVPFFGRLNVKPSVGNF